jgi:hypothetical protein
MRKINFKVFLEKTNSNFFILNNFKFLNRLIHYPFNQNTKIQDYPDSFFYSQFNFFGFSKYILILNKIPSFSEKWVKNLNFRKKNKDKKYLNLKFWYYKNIELKLCKNFKILTENVLLYI